MWRYQLSDDKIHQNAPRWHPERPSRLTKITPSTKRLSYGHAIWLDNSTLGALIIVSRVYACVSVIQPSVTWWQFSVKSQHTGRCCHGLVFTLNQQIIPNSRFQPPLRIPTTWLPTSCKDAQHRNRTCLGN